MKAIILLQFLTQDSYSSLLLHIQLQGHLFLKTKCTKQIQFKKVGGGFDFTGGTVGRLHSLGSRVGGSFPHGHFFMGRALLIAIHDLLSLHIIKRQ